VLGGGGVGRRANAAVAHCRRHHLLCGFPHLLPPQAGALAAAVLYRGAPLRTPHIHINVGDAGLVPLRGIQGQP